MALYNRCVKIVITGGHHSSALPVIKKLKDYYPGVRIYWFGHKFSAQGDKNPTLEFHEIAELDIPFYHIHAGKFYRTLNIIRLAKIPFGFFQCLYLLLKINPDAILSFGGYIAVPTVIAGWVLGIPSVTHEQTVAAGWANRLVSKVAKKVLISWNESAEYFPKEKTVFAGLPLRSEIFESKSQSFSSDNGLPTVYITTGKIGSHIINTVVGDCLKDLLAICNVIHQCGDNSVFNDYEMLVAAEKSLGKHAGRYYLRRFVYEDEVGEAYQRSDLVVARSGAHTTAELLALRKNCVLIPIPWVSHNEQFLNAQVLEKNGLGKILPEKDLSAQRLLEEIKTALGKTKALEGVVTREANNRPAELIVEQLALVLKR